jgi:hypothetical protein
VSGDAGKSRLDLFSGGPGIRKIFDGAVILPLPPGDRMTKCHNARGRASPAIVGHARQKNCVGSRWCGIRDAIRPARSSRSCPSTSRWSHRCLPGGLDLPLAEIGPHERCSEGTARRGGHRRPRRCRRRDPLALAPPRRPGRIGAFPAVWTSPRPDRPARAMQRRHRSARRPSSASTSTSVSAVPPARSSTRSGSVPQSGRPDRFASV